MIIKTTGGKSFDTEKDLTGPERHILQKLFIWETMAIGIDQFIEKKTEAMQKGWNESGPIRESQAMRLIVADLEKKLALRLAGDSPRIFGLSDRAESMETGGEPN